VESIPVYEGEYSAYQFEPTRKLVGVIVQIGAEDLFEAFFYPLADWGRSRLPPVDPPSLR